MYADSLPCYLTAPIYYLTSDWFAIQLFDSLTFLLCMQIPVLAIWLLWFTYYLTAPIYYLTSDWLAIQLSDSPTFLLCIWLSTYYLTLLIRLFIIWPFLIDLLSDSLIPLLSDFKLLYCLNFLINLLSDTLICLLFNCVAPFIIWLVWLLTYYLTVGFTYSLTVLIH